MTKVRRLAAVGTAALVLAFSGHASAGDWWSKLKSNRGGSDWTYKGVEALDLDSRVRHYKWETTRPPFGPYDKIALHRYVKDPTNDKMIPGLPARDKRKVLFVLGGTYDGEPYRVTKYTEPYYFASKGYDVYTIGYRTAYLPDLAYHQFASLGQLEGLRSTANWTYGAFREDIKAAVEMAKEISGAQKVFLAGRSRGGTQMYIYAAKYSKDLKGLIGLDGGAVFRRADNPAQQRTKEQYDAALQALRAGTGGNYLAEVGGYLNNHLAGVQEYAEVQAGGPLPPVETLPFGPPPDGQMQYLRDSIAYTTYYQTPVPGLVANVYGAHPRGGTFIEKEFLVNSLATLTRYWPRVQDIEASFLAGYADNPYLDYDDTQHVDVPILHFAGDFACPSGSCFSSTQPYATATSDITLHYLPGYGHLDIYVGTHSIEEVKKPALDWMNSRL